MVKTKKEVTPTYVNFDNKNYWWKSNVDYSKKPEQYKVGKGEQGVLICQPYKNQIGKYWKFKTPSIAFQSAQTIYFLFLDYLEKNDFVGADMCRKYLQMGFTRSRRYANYKSGKKYKKTMNKNYTSYLLNEKGSGSNLKAISASIFFTYYQKAEQNQKYSTQKKAWKEKYG